MHRLPSQYAVIRFQLASWLLFLIYLMIPATFGVLVYSVVVVDQKSMRLALGLIVATAVTAVIQWVAATRARCPLCHARSVARNGCSKHRAARRLFGSYRLRVACAVIFRKCFRCPYCGESTVVSVRDSAHRHHRHG